MASNDNNLISNIIKTSFIDVTLTVLIGVDSCGGDSGGPLVYRKGNDAEEPWSQFKETS